MNWLKNLLLLLQQPMIQQSSAFLLVPPWVVAQKATDISLLIV